ncbi:MTAP family purine nucleoside phosphorylase [Candidatus Woesearchaeota archaeon]|nr:MTAP family purine nucleoside phosphorylase [Candidatus Woesearchaeota archaeon]
MRYAFICGSSFAKSKLFDKCPVMTLETKYGDISYKEWEKCIILLRHGMKSNHPPHMINHKANIAGLKELGCEIAISLNSTGSLKKSIIPGSIIIADDYINFSCFETYIDNELRFLTPKMDSVLVELLLVAAKRVATDRMIQKGVYAMTHGPRYETQAEVRMLSQYADIVGMTMAIEASLAQEVDIRYGAICYVDNYANGAGDDCKDIELDFSDKKTVLLLDIVKEIKSSIED